MQLAIDVTGSSFFAAEGTCTGGVVTVARAGELRLPLNTVEDGEIKNRAAFIMSINKLLAAAHFTAGSVNFTFNSNSVLSRRLELPAAKPRDMARMVKNEMLQTVNETGEYIYEYAIVSDAPSNPNMKSVWAYAVPRDLVDEYFAVNKNTRLKPAALDIHPNCVEKLFLGAVVNGKPVGAESVLFVGIEEEELEIHLFSEGQRAFSRSAPVSSAEFRSLLGSLKAGSGEVSVEGLDIASEAFRSEVILADAAHLYISRVADELQKMVQFQLRRNSARPVSGVYIYGTMACMQGFDAGLSAALGIHVERVGEVSKIRAPQLALPKYINAIGALIRL